MKAPVRKVSSSFHSSKIVKSWEIRQFGRLPTYYSTCAEFKPDISPLFIMTISSCGCLNHPNSVALYDLLISLLQHILSHYFKNDS